MAEFHLLWDVLIVVVTALAGGTVARALRQPVLVGYLVGGVLVGPAGLGLLPGLESVKLVAEIGVGLLLFALGVEFSLSDLGRVGPVALGVGIMQMTATFALGMAAGQVLGWPPASSAYFGVAVALSSTAVALKILGDRGDLDSLHGRIVIGLMLVQDLAAVPALVVLPVLSTPTDDMLLSLAVALVKVTVFLAGGLAVGMRVGPWLLARIATLGSRELFMLAVVSLLAATVLAALAVGLSVAFGAFLAGLLVSESDHAQQALADIIPLRDTLAGFFFVSLGVLTDPGAALAAPALVLLILAILLMKSLLTVLATAFFRYPLATGLLVGAAVGQMGEFSFLVAQVGVNAGTLPGPVYGVLLVAAIISMVLTPAAVTGAERITVAAHERPRLAWLTARPEHVPPAKGSGQQGASLTNHAVICGYGRVGRHLVRVLRRRGLPVLVVDIDSQALNELRDEGIPCLYGDAATAPVLEHCGLARARVLAVTLGDRAVTELALRHARAINPRLDIVVRAPSRGGWNYLRDLGATELVQPEFEAALEVIRHTLHRFGLSGPEVGHIVAQLRNEGEE